MEPLSTNEYFTPKKLKRCNNGCGITPLTTDAMRNVNFLMGMHLLNSKSPE